MRVKALLPRTLHDVVITVQADHEVQKKPAGMTNTGIPIEEVSLSRKVGVRDLDLTG
jgi:hypothetical protein